MDPQFPGRDVRDPWIEQIRLEINNGIITEEEVAEQIPVTIFNVPKSLILIKPEAYIPQQVSIGPYHYERPEFYQMEKCTLSSAKKIQKQLRGHTFEEIVVKFTKLEPKIRACYHKSLDLDGETLTLLSAVDAAFLLELLLSYVEKEGDMLRKSVDRRILRDIIMLENQIPLFLVLELLDSHMPESWNEVVEDMFMGFYKDVSPIKKIAKFPRKKREFVERAHLLEFLYYLIVPSTLRGGGSVMVEIEASYGADLIKLVETPLVEEIRIPTVTKLASVGIRFYPTEGGLETIRFDKDSATFYLPVIDLDDTSEVVLRNLVAFEASVSPDATVFARYTEFMNGIIDNKGDVKLLREVGILLNHLNSDDEAASLWYGMSKSVKRTRVPDLEKIIEDINAFYSSKWSVKSKVFMKKCVLGSWSLLIVLTANFLLLMTAVLTFCSIFERCPSWLST